MKRIIYFLFAATTILSSCSKKDNLPAPGEKKLVKQWLDIGNNTIYEYDAKGQVTKMTSGDQEVTFEYSANSLRQKMRILSINLLTADITWTLNAKGLATSGAGTFNEPGQPAANITFTFTYNDDGYLVKHHATFGNVSSAAEYYYTGGDIIELKRFYNNNFSGKTKYYYPGKIANKIKIGVGDQQGVPGIKAFGKVNAHLVEKLEDIDKTGAVFNTLNYQYTLDGQGFPVQKNISGNSTNIEFYQYN
jgi:hypothetical protein